MLKVIIQTQKTKQTDGQKRCPTGRYLGGVLLLVSVGTAPVCVCVCVCVCAP